MMALQASRDGSGDRRLIDGASAATMKAAAGDRLARRWFGKCVLGCLIEALCALAACAGPVEPASPADSSIGMQEQSVADDNLGDDSIAPEDLASCLAQCEGDAECRHCCFCGAKVGCCF